MEALFAAIHAPDANNAGKSAYAVAPVPEYKGCYVGKDRDSYACLLIATASNAGRRRAPIRLENLDVQFALRCQVRTSHGPATAGTFTVIMCRSRDTQTTRYFLSVCETVLRLAAKPSDQQDISSTVHRLAAMFRKMQKPPARSVIGLFGELYLIWRSADPVRTLAAWRIDEVARFDFSDGEFRLDVKAASGRVRAHTCSYEQCNPPFGTTAVAASLFVERVAAGLSLRSLIEQIEAVVGQPADLALKLHEIVAATLGRSLGDALESTFDVPLADGSLLFFDLRDVPAIREPLPANVSDVHFRSNFSGTTPIAPEQLKATHPRLASFLPHPTGSNYSIS